MSDQWQPFATAPETPGEQILAYREDAGVFAVEYYIDDESGDGEGNWFSAGGLDDLTGDLPSHWMPLPAPPSLVGHGPNKALLWHNNPYGDAGGGAIPEQAPSRIPPEETK